MAEHVDAAAVVLDLLLPDLTGQKLLHRLLKAGRTLPPVIVVTAVFKGAGQQEKLREMCPLAGWYEKPFDTRLLVEQVARLAGRDPVARKPQAPFDTDSEDRTVFDALTFSARTPTPDQVATHLKTGLRTGDLARTTVPSLISAFYAAQETGEIALQRGERRRLLLFSRGRPVHAMANDLKTSAFEIAKRTFAWASGRYAVGFRAHAVLPSRDDPHPGGLKTDADAAAAPEGVIDPARLILEGVRELFEVDRLRALVPPKMRPVQSPSAAFPLYELPLTDLEAKVLLRATGDRSVDTILREMGGRAERVTLAALYSLLTLGVLVDVRALP